jgi:hypothetical protein
MELLDARRALARQGLSCQPGEIATATGAYDLLTPTGMQTMVRVAGFRGAALPVAPPGWCWLLDPGGALPPA